jgi:hypothetical protein
MKSVFNLKIYCTLSLFVLLGAVACKKSVAPIDEEIVSPITGTRTQFTLDSIFLYARQIYLWNDALPTYAAFNPRNKYGSITPELTAFKKELFDISQIKINPGTQLLYELPVYAGNPKYSYLQAGHTTGGSTADLSGTSTSAIVKSTVISSNGKNIGYISLNAFPKLSAFKDAIDACFASLSASNPSYLILDLRDNGGGYTETAEYFANQIASTALNGQVMYTEQFNAQMQAGQSTILKHQPYLDNAGKTVIYNGRMATMADVDYTEKGNTYFFNKKGNLEGIQKIYFIVSGKTASASEMLISCLKPYFEVKLIGEKTYGKPIGFFGINIDQYSVFLSSFFIRNAAGWSDYFDGMAPDVIVKGTDNPDLGNPEELCLKAAVALLNGINATTTKLSVTKLQQTHPFSLTRSVNTPMSIGAIERRLKLKN